MSTFPEAWLRLREPYDHAARDGSPLEALLGALPRAPRVLELGAGLGSGMRWLAPRLPGSTWTLVDHDPALLAVLQREHPEVDVLEHDLEALASLTVDADLVQCQALLDLASEPWLEALAGWLDARRVPFLAALTVDGRVVWTPEDPEDARVQEAFRAHQLTDRGFGPSPGYRAGEVFRALLEARGWRVHTWTSDWEIPAGAEAMVRAMVLGTSEAAGEVLGAAEVEAWTARRLRRVEDTALLVGHLDLLALPPGGSVEPSGKEAAC